MDTLTQIKNPTSGRWDDIFLWNFRTSKEFSTSTVCVIYPRPHFVPRRPNRHHLHIPCGARGWEHKSEEYLNLTLLSNASWPTFITITRSLGLSILCPCSPEAITPIVPKEIKVLKFNLFLSLFFSQPFASARIETESIRSKSSRDKECIQDEIMWRGGGWGGCSQWNLWECTFC